MIDTPCVNTLLINKHIDEQDEIEQSFERLSTEFLDDIIGEIEDLIDTAKKLGADWEGRDFSKDAEDWVKAGL